ncbi:MAG TPA: hypothetical protein VGB17_04240 [Pyrinomonadaceae bacterium]|jgi:RNA polymerase sigma factor (sigma-70 family)
MVDHIIRQKKQWALTQEAFDTLLAWLSPDREQAGEKYERIRTRLIKVFTVRGCFDAEDLADETINRVAKKVKDIADTYIGDPSLFFYGVARNVHLEYVKKKVKPLPQLPAADEDKERKYECLDQCIKLLPQENREIVLQYYLEEKKARINNRREMARRLGIELNALRIRAHRIRASLKECVDKCLSLATTG